MKNIFNEIYIELTHCCTARCDHCYLGCCCEEKGRLLVKDIKGLIDAIPTMSQKPSAVVLSGGEPTLYWNECCDIIDYSKKMGFKTELVTNVWWAETFEIAMVKVGELRDAGLMKIQISFSGYHLKYVPLPYIQNAIKACVASNIEIYLLLRYDNENTERALLEKLGDSVYNCTIMSAPILPFGRAQHIDIKKLSVFYIEKLNGSCSHDLSLTISPNGDIYPCCCGTECTKALRLGNIKDYDLIQKLQDAENSIALFNITNGAFLQDNVNVANTFSICSVCMNEFKDKSLAQVENDGNTLCGLKDYSLSMDIYDKALQLGRKAPSHTFIYLTANYVVKIAIGTAAEKLKKQCTIIREYINLGLSGLLPEIINVYESDECFGYIMPRYNKVSKNTDSIILAKSIINRIERIWMLPTQNVLQLDTVGYISRTASILDKYAPSLVNDYIALGNKWLRCLVSKDCCHIHGDPTFDNTVLDPISNAIIMIDVNPQSAPALCLPESDIAKVLQSLFGWERFVRNKIQLLEIDAKSIKEFLSLYKYNWQSVFWIAISHLIRTLPYGANVNDANKLIPSIELAIRELKEYG